MRLHISDLLRIAWGERRVPCHRHGMEEKSPVLIECAYILNCPELQTQDSSRLLFENTMESFGGRLGWEE
jgi:hypothetical protein